MSKKPETVRMRFREDKFYSDLNVPLYRKGIIYDVPLDKKDRWVKRGGELVDEDPAPEEMVAKPDVPLDQTKAEHDTSGAEILDSGEEESLEPAEEKADDSREKPTTRGRPNSNKNKGR